MKLMHVNVKNLFSFDDVQIDLDGNTAVILGPNGSGKTNLFRSLDLAATALRWVAEELTPSLGASETHGPAGRALLTYGEMSHLGRAGVRRVGVGIHLDLEDEKDLVVAFLRAAIPWSIREELGNTGAEAGIKSWTTETITRESIEPLFTLELVAEHSGVPGRSWQVGIDFRLGSEGPGYRWTLEHHSMRGYISPLDSRGNLTVNDAPSHYGIAESLIGITNASPTPPLPDPLPPFALKRLATSAPCGPIVLGAPGKAPIDWTLPSVQDFFFRLGVLRPSQSPLQTQQKVYSLGVVLWHIWQEKVFFVQEQLRGIGSWGRALDAAGVYDLKELQSALASTEPYLLPARLFRFTNGNAKQRQRSERLKNMFAELSGGKHVSVRALPVAPVTETEEGAENDQGRSPAEDRMLIDLLVSGPSAPSMCASFLETPIQFCGAGVWEALVLAEALTAPPGSVVLLDEPAANLHPSWQRILRGVLTRHRAQFLIITHAADVVPLAVEETDICLLRFKLKSTGTEAHQIQAQLLADCGRKLKAKGNTHHLFVNRAVLVEGQDDLDVLRILNDRFKLELEGPDATIVECGSRENLPDYIRVCRHLDIRHLVVMDGDFTKASNKDFIQEQINSVRGQIEAPLGDLFEFKEDIEHAFKLDQKNPRLLRQRAKEVSGSTFGLYPEVDRLYCRLRSFVQKEV